MELKLPIIQRLLADPGVGAIPVQLLSLPTLPSLPGSLIASMSVTNSRSDKSEWGERGESALGEAKLTGDGEER